MSDNVVYVGQKCQTFESSPPWDPISKIVLHRDDETTFIAGDDTGRSMEMEHPGATQAMADDILSGLKGYVYRPYRATGVRLDPAVELGDPVYINGIYSIIASMYTDHMTGLSEISAPGGNEIDHEYPYKTPHDLELRRRVKLEQKYFGTKISRREGLVVEKTDGETVTAKVVLNADELSFYDAASNRVLFFDPTSGTYKFMGMLNVSDNFVVDKNGNVTLNGTIKWGVGNEPNKKRYATTETGTWHSDFQAGDVYCCDWNYKTETWGPAYKFVAKDGAPGQDGSDANVPRYIKGTSIDATGIETFHIKANKLEAICPSGSAADKETGFILTGAFENEGLRYLRIYSYGGLPPTVVFTSPQGCHATFDFGGITLRTGSLDLSAVGNINWGSNAPTAVFA